MLHLLYWAGVKHLYTWITVCFLLSGWTLVGFPQIVLGVSVTSTLVEVLFRQLVLIPGLYKLLKDKQGRGSTETTYCYNKISPRGRRRKRVNVITVRLEAQE